MCQALKKKRWQRKYGEEGKTDQTDGVRKQIHTHTHTHTLCKALGSYYISSATAKSFQSCPTLFDPSPGIFRARTLKWVAISFSNA